MIRQLIHWGYRTVIKPLLFRKSPDKVHKDLVKLAGLVQKIPPVRSMPRIWAEPRGEVLAQTIAGIEFSSPIGLSAGFDKEISMARLMQAVDFGWMTGGSVTWGQYAGNEGNWFYRLPKTKSLVVNAGLPSSGTESVLRRLETQDPAIFKDFPLNVSVAKTNTKQTVDEKDAVEDYCKSLAAFDTQHAVKMLEINISCPNTFGGEPFTTPERLQNLLESVDALQLTKPVFIKMPINLDISAYDALLDVIIRHNVQGIAVGNLQKDRAKVSLKENLPSGVKGNLSGAPTREISTDLIRHTYQKYGTQLAIIGIGGVMSATDAYEKICAGASLVGLITGLIFEGPTLPAQINHDLKHLLEADGYTSIQQAIGSKA